jgi:GNAT superfamily N-acetyltransferase
MNDAVVRIVAAGAVRDRYLPLLYLADDSVAQVSSYYQLGDLYVWDDDSGEPIGIALAIPEGEGEVELKAVAITEVQQSKGIGKRLLAAVLASLRAKHIHRVIVGTGNSGIGQLAFYQKAGFRMWKIERDFFSTERGYADGIEENGIPLRDMVWMDQYL